MPVLFASTICLSSGLVQSSSYFGVEPLRHRTKSLVPPPDMVSPGALRTAGCVVVAALVCLSSRIGIHASIAALAFGVAVWA
jgi:hypothetical protein